MNSELENTLRQYVGRVVTFQLDKSVYTVPRFERPFFIGIVDEQELIIRRNPISYKKTLESFVFAGTKKTGRLCRRIFSWSIDWKTFKVLSLEEGVIWKIEHGL